MADIKLRDPAERELAEVTQSPNFKVGSTFEQLDESQGAPKKRPARAMTRLGQI